MRPLLALLILAGSSFAQGKLDPNQPYQGRKSNPITFEVDFSAVVTPPYKAKVLKIWMPIPPSDAIQEVTESTFTTFPVELKPQIAAEPMHGNRFAYFEFKDPQGAQIVRHRFTVKLHQVNWDVDPEKVEKVTNWPDSFKPYLRDEPFIPVNDRFLKVAEEVVKQRSSPAVEMATVFAWINNTMKYSHEECSLQASAVFALDNKIGHCSDYHGLATALGRSLGYPARMTYGINPYPKNSPSHCRMEVYLPPYGWVSFDVSETQQMIAKIQKNASLTDEERMKFTALATRRLEAGFRDNAWFLQTRGSDYDLAPPAANKVAVVRTIYAEADGVPYAEPDPANPKAKALTWMTVHHYKADRPLVKAYDDVKTLLQQP